MVSVNTSAPVAPGSVGDPTPPSSLSPDLWALQILGQLSYYHLLLGRLANLTPGSDEYNWVQSQMKACSDFITKAEAAEVAYETANPGQTYLTAGMCTLLSQAGNEMSSKPSSPFDTWWKDNLMNIGGSGSSILDYLQAICADEFKEGGIQWSSQDPNLMSLAFGISMLFTDVDNDNLGQLGGLDNLFFNVHDWHNPFKPYGFPKEAAEAIAFFLYNSFSPPPQPGTDTWKQFTTQLGYMGNLLNPKNLPTPGPANYSNNFWADFTADETAFNNGKFPNGDTPDQAFSDFFKSFNYKFVDQE